jgi:ABC-type branched-subunit amino acid transport system ATPase component
MQDRPSAPELLDALAAMLVTEVRDWVPRERRFQILVAANLCAVVARELRAGTEPSVADARLFRELLGSGATDPAPEDADTEAREAAAELARRLRAGELDDELDRVASELQAHVRRKLEIARPGYWEGPTG